MVMQAGLDKWYLKNNYQPNPKLRYAPSIAAVAKAGRKKDLKQEKGPLEKKGKKKKVKLTLIEKLELGTEIQMGIEELATKMEAGAGTVDAEAQNGQVGTV